tara:strand:- start:184 stop:387 length:204 start_codon:yes stop_codon:yes gene_type:complete
MEELLCGRFYINYIEKYSILATFVLLFIYYVIYKKKKVLKGLHLMKPNETLFIKKREIHGKGKNKRK